MASRLKPGTVCVITGSEMQGSRVQVDSDFGEAGGEVEPFAVKLAKSRGLEPAESEAHPTSKRAVEVVILDGAKKGQTTSLPRYLLRPLTAP